MKTKLILTGLALMALTTMMNAQNATVSGQAKGQGKGVVYTDKNNDGKCDNYSVGKCNGSGKCDGTNKCKGKGVGSGKGKGKK